MRRIEQVPAADWQTWVDDKEAILLDVREPAEWRLGTLPGAILMSMGEIVLRQGELPSDKPILCVCRSGNRSNRVAAHLRKERFRRCQPGRGDEVSGDAALSLRVELIRTEGLGDSTYVLIHDGQAIVVDPQRDFDRITDVLDAYVAEPRLILETHVHNDYVSGGLPLSRTSGAELVFPAAATPIFKHRPAFHREPIALNGLSVVPLHTPGHTPEHTSYLIELDGSEVAIFSGGSLLVGSAGRTDLLGDEYADTLARRQFASLRRLATLPDAVDLYPTHGAGSFCTATGAGALTSSIGAERASNPFLGIEDEEEFVKRSLGGLPDFPTYYAHMAPLNRVGAEAAKLDVPELDEIPRGVTVIDARPKTVFASGHNPDALGIELRSDFGVWVGWLTEHNTPLALILDPAQDADDAVRQLARIGYDDIRGIVRSDDGPSSFETVDLDEFVRRMDRGGTILDVRASNEWENGVIEDSVRCYLPDLMASTPEALDEDAPVLIACGTGYRASIAASILEKRGYRPVVLVDSGVPEVLATKAKTT